tara:strand:+ start:13 stop:795 length:783 start_codon:yes stop_codon:yes gene_type:complete
MKGIILAAGLGSRLSKYTRDCPKGLLNFLGKSLLEHQLELMRALNVEDITIVKGYMADKIEIPKVNYYTNYKFKETNMVESLFCAKEILEGPCIITYSDVIYEKALLEKVLLSKKDIGVVVDNDFEDYWKARLGSEYLSDSESLVIKNDTITSIGNTSPTLEEINGRYVGIIKLSGVGSEIFTKTYNTYSNTEELNKLGNRVFKKWHMTDFLQSIIDKNIAVDPIMVSRGWLEFDTDEDYERYHKWAKTGSLNRFFRIKR